MHALQIILLIGTPGTSAEPDEVDIQEITQALSEDQLISAKHCPSLSGDESFSVYEQLDVLLPDLICIFPDSLKNTPIETILNFCQNLRQRAPGKQKPVLVVHGQCTEEQRISYFVNGADDILDPDLSLDELKVRLLVHLRRNLEAQLQDITLLPNLQFAHKVTQRRLNTKNHIALLAIEINGLTVYTENYGTLATWQVLKTLVNILGNIVLFPDCIFHSDENYFVILSHPDKADKLANLICRQFEAAIPNFYSEPERKRGYMVSDLSHHISRRVSLLQLSIGVASNDQQPFNSFLSGYHLAQQMKQIAKEQPGSTWHSSKRSLSGEKSLVTGRKPLTILLLEPDEALAYLLKTALTMEGYLVNTTHNVEDASEILFKQGTLNTELLILDVIMPTGSSCSNTQESPLTFARQVTQAYPALHVICTSSLHNRQHVLEAGIDLYLPKPYELSLLFYWIRQLAM